MKRLFYSVLFDGSHILTRKNGDVVQLGRVFDLDKVTQITMFFERRTVVLFDTVKEEKVLPVFFAWADGEKFDCTRRVGYYDGTETYEKNLAAMQEFQKELILAWRMLKEAV